MKNASMKECIELGSTHPKEILVEFSNELFNSNEGILVLSTKDEYLCWVRCSSLMAAEILSRIVKNREANKLTDKEIAGNHFKANRS